MEFKVLSKVAAASPAHARPSRLARGWSRISFGSAPAAKGVALCATSDSPITPATSDNPITPVSKEERVDRSETLTLDMIRHSLIRQEDSIIFALLERAQFLYNANTYDRSAFPMDGFDGSLVEYIVRETEKLHAQVGRYKSPDEHSFFPKDLAEPLLPPIQYPTAHTAPVSSHAQSVDSIQADTTKAHTAPVSSHAQSVDSIQADTTKVCDSANTIGPPAIPYRRVLHPAAEAININKKIWKMYFDELLPRLVKEGSDGNYGSTALCDTICLQALSKRIHYGKFVAEAKFLENPEAFIPAIIEQNPKRLMELLTYPNVERSVENRVESKAKIFGQEVNFGDEDNSDPPVYKIRPSLVAELYTRRIMPLTKDVQVAYLLRRLD